MATNGFLPFAAGSGANVVTDLQWSANNGRQLGFTRGTAQSNLANKAWLQSSVAAAAVMQFATDWSGNDCLDSTGIGTLVSNLRTAIAASQSGAYFGVDTSSSADVVTITLVPNPTTAAFTSFQSLWIKVANTNTGGVTVQQNNFQSQLNWLRNDGSALQAGDIRAGTIYPVVNDGTAIKMQGPTVSQITALGGSSTNTTLNNYQIAGGRTATYSAAGSSQWTVPAGVSVIRVLDCIGGGGGGGGASGFNAAGSAGGGGGNAKDGVYSVTPGEVLTIVVGAGGAGGSGGASPTNGATGGTSYIQRSNGTTLCSASGGGGGFAGNGSMQSASRGVGGAAVGGARNFQGSGGGFPIQITASLALGGIGGPAGAAAGQPQINASAGGLDGFPRGGGANGSSASAAGGIGGVGEVSFNY